ncbi:MAG: DNA repair protein RecO [Clostridiaceae bacterium]|nr:DNA repair protein RecO [Clostridiaceae bacterium]
MREQLALTGIILTASPIREYDRRVEILTRERGRIAAFAQGARRAASPLSACTIPFTFGEFVLYPGRNSYSLKAAAIQKYFGDIAADYDMACYASYFAEMAQYFTRENIEASAELLLLYVTLLSMQKGVLALPLIRVIYEMRMLQIQGQGIELFECLHCHQANTSDVYFSMGGLVCKECAAKEKELRERYPFVLSPDALHALQYILSAPIEKLYSFTVTEEILEELRRFMHSYLGRFLPHAFKALEFLE